MKNIISRSWRFARCAGYLVFALLAAQSMTSACRALEIPSGTLQQNDRFYQGTDKAFLGQNFDWSGVGRSTNPFRDTWLTMISPSYYISARHYHPHNGETAFFSHTNDPTGPFEGHVVASGQQLGSTDTWLGKLATPVSTAVAKYPIYPLLGNFSDYRSKEIFVVGRSPFSNPGERQFDVGIGRNHIDFIVGGLVPELRHSFSSSAADEARVIPGDSGAPSFILENNQLGFASTHWKANSTTFVDAFLPSHIDTIRSIVEANGESLVKFVPEPATWSMIGLIMVLVSFGLQRKWRQGGVSAQLTDRNSPTTGLRIFGTLDS